MNPLMPMNEAVLNSALILFSKVSVILAGLVGALFLIRISILALKLSGAYEYGKLASDVVCYFAMIHLFPILVRVVINVTGNLAEKISYIPASQAQGLIEEFFRKLFSGSVIMQVFSKIGDLLMNLISQSIYTVFISLLLAIAPVVIFLSTILGITQGVNSYFKTLIVFCLWPVLWNLIGLLGRELWPFMGNSPASTVTFWLVIQVLQFTSPIFCVLLFHSLSPTQSLSKIVTIGR